MMDQKKSKIAVFDIVVVIVFAATLWIFITNAVQALLCPELTYTELFLHIPKSVIGQWEHCD